MTQPVALPPPLFEESGWFDVIDEGTATFAVTAAEHISRRAGLNEARITDTLRACRQLITDMYQNSGGGRVAMRCLRRSGIAGVEIVTVDSGPGVPHVSNGGYCAGVDAEIGGRQLSDIFRLASHYDEYCLPGRGSVIAAQFWPRGFYPGSATAAGLTRPMVGEGVSGDRFSIRLRDEGPVMIVVDGLGHGLRAAEAATAAIEAFHAAGADTPAELVERIHHAISHTTGAAVAVAQIDIEDAIVRFAGLGNISAAIVSGTDEACAGCATPGRVGMISQGGVAGHQSRDIRESSYPICDKSIVILHSDGVTDRWDLAAYPGLVHHEPLVIAATLLRDAGIRPDDACVLVAKAGRLTCCLD